MATMHPVVRALLGVASTAERLVWDADAEQAWLRATEASIGTLYDVDVALSEELEALAYQAALAGDLDRARALLRASEIRGTDLDMPDRL